MLIKLLKTISYKLSQADQTERIQTLKDLNRLDGFKIKQIIAAMTEVYVSLNNGDISKSDALEVMKLIENDLKEV